MYKVIKLFIKILIVIVIGAVVAFLVYYFKPLNKSVFIYQKNVDNKNQLTCETSISTSIFAEPNFEKKSSREVKADISSDGSKIAIEIGEEYIQLLTSTTVEMGRMEPLKLEIINNNKDDIVALMYEQASLGNNIVHSFVLHKKTGFAIWSKSNSTMLADDDGPYNVVSYLACH